VTGTPKMADDIDWTRAVFGGAWLGGIMWAIVARLTVVGANPAVSATSRWLALAAVCFGLILAGLAVARWVRRGLIRTAATALTIAPMTGGSMIVIFVCLRMVFG
jgi:hypothetical protein